MDTGLLCCANADIFEVTRKITMQIVSKEVKQKVWL